MFFSESNSAAVVPSPKNGNSCNSPGSNVLVLPSLLCSVCFCEIPNALPHADYHSLMDSLLVCMSFFKLLSFINSGVGLPWV